MNLRVKLVVTAVMAALMIFTIQCKKKEDTSAGKNEPNIEQPDASMAEGDILEDGQRYVNTKSGLIMRESPSTDGKKIMLLPYGSAVDVLDDSGPIVKVGNKSGVWTKISFQDKEAWAFGAFLSEKKPADAPEHPEKDAKDFKDDENQVTAVFVSFEFGDVAHYTFKTEDGKSITFVKNNTEHLLHIDAPDSEANEQNQGFIPNPKLLNKKFKITMSQETLIHESVGQKSTINVIEKAEILE